MFKVTARIAAILIAASSFFMGSQAHAGVPLPVTPPTDSWMISDLTTGGTSPWSFGTTGTSVTGAFTAFTQLNTTWDGLYSYLSLVDQPGFGIGSSGSADYVTENITIPVGSLNFQPGADNEYSVIRFTAPYAGSFRVNADFMGADRTPTNSEAYIVSGGQVLFHETIEGFGFTSYRSGSPTVNLAAGQTIDFLVGQGAGDAYSDSTLFTGSVAGFAAAVPEPSTYAMMFVGLGLIGFTASKRRKMPAAFKINV